MTRSLVFLLTFLTQWGFGACQLYYWVDQSCAGKINGVVGDALRMAAGASLRLNNPQDLNQQQLFTRFFKAQPNDANAVAEVQRVMGGIGTFRSTLDRPSSDVRIYCDNDRLAPEGRWTAVPDIPGDPYPNSQRRDRIDKEYEDVLNGLGRATTTMGCLDGNTRAETYFILRNPQNTIVNQNPRRCTITLCDSAQVDENDNPIRIKSFFDVDPRSDFTQGNIVDTWETLISMNLLHELTHISHFGKIDVKLPQLTPKSNGDLQEAIGYELVDNEIQTSTDALKNSDSFAQFGLFARLADFHYRLDSDPALANDGQLQYDVDLLPPNIILNGLPLSRRRSKRAELIYNSALQ